MWHATLCFAGAVGAVCVRGSGKRAASAAYDAEGQGGQPCCYKLMRCHLRTCRLPLISKLAAGILQAYDPGCLVQRAVIIMTFSCTLLWLRLVFSKEATSCVGTLSKTKMSNGPSMLIWQTGCHLHP